MTASYVDFTAAAFAFAAAVLWFYAAFGTDVYVEEQDVARGDVIVSKKGRLYDVRASMIKQSRWISYAAIAAGIAAALQCIGLMMKG
ncbi:hypothetical protein [Bradyrhizobium erythrophlei]|uniref:Uncharacterized protein n=1 Tax=Bradyrhizobium erythrophlei TaxID=1437360 RepID=A0A1M7UDC8_9BRAD|nr:hypothetical protein [Bradyrhizobium erythrophlei]SHN81009.1 hypothetical protein SAMN05444170_4578 [Bradyrhizobium erythrophlei]